MVEIRKIETKEQIEKKQKRRTKMLVGLMLLLLLGSTAGYAFLSSNKTDTSSGTGVKGVRDLGGQWSANINGQSLIFSNPPNVTDQTEINLTYSLASYSQKPVYVSGSDKRAAYEIAATLGQYALRFQEACYGNCSLDLPTKTCNDLLIVLNETNAIPGRVYQKDNCVFIEGDLSTVDAFLYRIFGLA